MYDVIILGGGPAGCAAAIYAARKKMSTLLITQSFGGQSVVSDDIQNWIGETHISGFDLAQKLEKHLRSYEGDGVTIALGELVTTITTANCIEPGRKCDFEVRTNKNFYTGKSIVYALGSSRRKLGVPGEEEFNGKGVAYCATCDAPLFRDKEVVVIGAGNSGLETVLDLVPYATHITLLERGDAIRGDASTAADVLKKSSVSVLLSTGIKKIIGSTFVESVEIINFKTGEERILPAAGVFVEIGSMPNTELVASLVNRDSYGQIVTDAKYASTSLPGFFAAGDVTDDPYKQNSISAGDGVRAALSAYAYVQQREKNTPAAG